MQITDVRIRLASGEGKLKAYAAVTFDDCFVVHNIKVLDGVEGFFLAMPNRSTGRGERRDVAHPINAGFRAELQAKVVAAYNLALSESGSADDGGRDSIGAGYSGAGGAGSDSGENGSGLQL